MAVQQGFLYEQNAFKALKKYKLSHGTPAGAASDKPDLTIKVGKAISGVELKNQPTAAGSLVMQYYDGGWHFGPTDNNIEKEFLKSIGEKINIIKTMNEKWKNPVLRYKNGQKYYVGAKDQKEGYKLDIAKFGGEGTGDIYVDVPNKVIADYYNSKKCFYLNVGTHGFYLLNKKDPLGILSKLKKSKLNPVPDFSDKDSAKTKVRVRCQYKSPGYQFSFTLQFGSVMKSPYNMAPLRPGSSSTIDTTKLQKDAMIAILAE